MKLPRPNRCDRTTQSGGFMKRKGRGRNVLSLFTQWPYKNDVRHIAAARDTRRNRRSRPPLRQREERQRLSPNNATTALKNRRSRHAKGMVNRVKFNDLPGGIFSAGCCKRATQYG